MPRRHLCMMSIDHVFLRRVTARFRSKGSNGSNSHPKAGSSWSMACPYSPMLPSVLAVVNVEGAHTRTTTDPLRSHPTPTALPQELHRCDLESSHSPHNRRRTPPPLKCPVQGRRKHGSPNFSRTRETAYVSPSFSFVQKKRQTQLPQLAMGRP